MIGQALGHYRIEAKLGEGGMGVVYRAFDTHLDRPVAIKVLRADVTTSPERKRRFLQEAKAASALNHPNIIHIYDISSSDGTDFIAMEFVDGKTLGQLIGTSGLPLRKSKAPANTWLAIRIGTPELIRPCGRHTTTRACADAKPLRIHGFRILSKGDSEPLRQ